MSDTFMRSTTATSSRVASSTCSNLSSRSSARPTRSWTLDTEPLPDEPFDWSAVDPADRAFVEEVLALSDGWWDATLGVEYRTVARRLLARVAARDPRPFRRSPHAHRCAASLVWLAGDVNGGFFWRGRRSSAWVWKWFGVGNCADRGRSLGRAAGFDHWYASPVSGWAVGEPSLLTSQYREVVIRDREHLLDIAQQRRTWRVTGTDGCVERIEVRVESTSFVSAAKGVMSASERLAVIVGFGDRVEDAHYLALSIPDVYDLVRGVQRAEEPPPHQGLVIEHPFV